MHKAPPAGYAPVMLAQEAQSVFRCVSGAPRTSKEFEQRESALEEQLRRADPVYRKVRIHGGGHTRTRIRWRASRP
jgi:hypothetical protein